MKGSILFSDILADILACNPCYLLQEYCSESVASLDHLPFSLAFRMPASWYTKSHMNVMYPLQGREWYFRDTRPYFFLRPFHVSLNIVSRQFAHFRPFLLFSLYFWLGKVRKFCGFGDVIILIGRLGGVSYFFFGVCYVAHFYCFDGLFGMAPKSTFFSRPSLASFVL